MEPWHFPRKVLDCFGDLDLDFVERLDVIREDLFDDLSQALCAPVIDPEAFAEYFMQYMTINLWLFGSSCGLDTILEGCTASAGEGIGHDSS